MFNAARVAQFRPASLAILAALCSEMVDVAAGFNEIRPKIKFLGGKGIHSCWGK